MEVKTLDQIRKLRAFEIPPSVTALSALNGIAESVQMGRPKLEKPNHSKTGQSVPRDFQSTLDLVRTAARQSNRLNQRAQNLALQADQELRAATVRIQAAEERAHIAELRAQEA